MSLLLLLDRNYTCYTLKQALGRESSEQQPEPEDGQYKVDPTGPNSTVPPFEVFCNMTTGNISLWHHSIERGFKISKNESVDLNILKCI